MPRPAPKRPPHLLDYEDYRAFLRDHYAYQKSRSRRYSYAVFARRAGVGRAHLKLVADYGHDLSRSSLSRYVEALRLPGDEAAYFRLLVAANQARTPREKAAALAELRRWRVQRTVSATSRQGAEEMSVWSRILVLGLSRLKGFRAHPGWISSRLRGQVSPAEAARAVRFLREGGYLALRKGRLVRTTAGRHQMTEKEHPAQTARIRQRILDMAADPSIRAFEFGGLNFAMTVLSRKEASELTRRHMEWLFENLPAATGRRGELCIVVGDILPLTGGALAARSAAKAGRF